jgi:hypothetical protein
MSLLFAMSVKASAALVNLHITGTGSGSTSTSLVGAQTPYASQTITIDVVADDASKLSFVVPPQGPVPAMNVTTIQATTATVRIGNGPTKTFAFPIQAYVNATFPTVGLSKVNGTVVQDFLNLDGVPVAAYTFSGNIGPIVDTTPPSWPLLNFTNVQLTDGTYLTLQSLSGPLEFTGSMATQTPEPGIALIGLSCVTLLLRRR